jgi:hypothetical protein
MAEHILTLYEASITYLWKPDVDRTKKENYKQNFSLI